MNPLFDSPRDENLTTEEEVDLIMAYEEDETEDEDLQICSLVD